MLPKIDDDNLIWTNNWRHQHRWPSICQLSIASRPFVVSSRHRHVGAVVMSQLLQPIGEHRLVGSETQPCLHLRRITPPPEIAGSLSSVLQRVIKAVVQHR